MKHCPFIVFVSRFASYSNRRRVAKATHERQAFVSPLRYRKHSLNAFFTYADYQQCMNGDIPALWWRYFQRLNG